MAYNNFKPTIWARSIQMALTQEAILAEFCNTEFEGDAQLGNKVNILNAAAPTISDYDQSEGLSDPETQEGTIIPLEINQAKSFNFMVGDIDKKQSVPGLVETLCGAAGQGLADARDKYIASLAANATMKSTAAALTTPAAVKKAIDTALLALREKNVALSAKVRIELPYWMYQLFRDELVEIKTQNDDLIKKGIVGWYDGAVVVATNNIHNDGTSDLAMVRTNKAIALATQINETEAYRPDKFFSDAVRGLMVYGAKIARPDEIYAIHAKKA